MREKQIVLNEIEEKEHTKSVLQKELSEHEQAFSNQTEPLRKKISEIKEEKDKIVRPRVSPVFTVFSVIFLIVAIANFAYFDVKYLTWVALGLIAVVQVFKVISQKANNKRYSNKCQKKESEISYLLSQITSIEKDDPEIALLHEKINSTDSDIRQLRGELNKIEISEKMGTNNCIISVNNSHSFFYYIDANAKLQSVNHYSAYIKIDGENKGTVTSPFSIVPLKPGIHSLSIEFDPNVNGTTFTLTENQFRLDNNNKYFSYKNLNYNLAGKNKGFTLDSAAYDTLEQFLSHAEIGKYDFESYIRNL